MLLEALREEVWRANLDLEKYGLVTLTWGNVSGIDRDKGWVVIKPSGVDYDRLTPADLVIVDINGQVIEGDLRPSSDTPTHLALYQTWTGIGGIAHTHSTYATMFAQACRPIPCLGTTHADTFHGYIPVTRMLSAPEVSGEYENATGAVILERFERPEPVATPPDPAHGALGQQQHFIRLNPFHTPAVLVAGHGPFTWGTSARLAAQHAVVLEEVARMAFGTLALAPSIEPLPDHVAEKHFQRKHGPGAYYGQPR